MILVDANVLMYAAGADHPNKLLATKLLERVAAGEIDAALDAEVLQEIIHRYRALQRWADGRKVYDLARRLFPHVLAITGSVMDLAKQLADDNSSISARDAVHASVVAVYQLQGIYSFDTDFDRIAGCRRLLP